MQVNLFATLYSIWTLVHSLLPAVSSLAKDREFSLERVSICLPGRATRSLNIPSRGRGCGQGGKTLDCIHD